MAQFCAAATGPPGRLAWSIIPPPLTIKTGFRKAAAAAGVAWATPHVLKHTAISWLAEAGWTVDQIADFTGTGAKTVARVYRKVSPASLRGQAETLGRALEMCPVGTKRTNRKQA